MEGQILGNRYELLEKIGGGGMAHVYKAKCKLLNRFVAIKILRPEFTNDDEFVKRFRIEAQSAASLSHPNIVSVYDVGHEQNIHYIVMEYIDGVTLKEYISKKGALPWKEAVNIAIQVCSAIEQAHKNHIIHRDIKPHNILLTKDGIAKVTDFGIARAVSSSTITMVGSTIGSVHYFSPEQAKGGYTDEKSDLYSLGIALYEMVTGRLPFDGETPIAVALKHIQVEAQHPIEIDADIPSGVNSIIMKAIKKDQNIRYQTASNMLEDLYRVLKDPYGDFVTEEIIADCPTRRIPAISSENLTQKDGREDGMNKKDGKKSDKITVWLAVATSLVIIAIFTYIGYSIVIPAIGLDQKEFEVKNYVGRNFDDVKEELAKSEIDVKDRRKTDSKIPKDTIMSQSVGAGNKLKLGGYNSIEVDVSDGPNLVKIPDLKKIDNREAEIKLKDIGLVARFEDEYNDTIAVGWVIKTDPDVDEEVMPGAIITIYRSKGPEIKETEVPDLVGRTDEEAKKLLADAKLVVGKVVPENGSNFVDKVIKQSPAPMTKVNEGTPVDIYFEADNGGIKYMSEMISLGNPSDYGDKVKVLVVITPSDTNKPQTLMDETKDKNDFPLTISVPVPEKGSTQVKVFLDNVLYAQLTKDSTGR